MEQVLIFSWPIYKLTNNNYTGLKYVGRIVSQFHKQKKMGCQEVRTCPRNIWTLQVKPNMIEIKARHFGGKLETVKSRKFQHEAILQKKAFFNSQTKYDVCLLLSRRLLKFETVWNTLTGCQLVRTELLAKSNSICKANRLGIEIQ